MKVEQWLSRRQGNDRRVVGHVLEPGNELYKVTFSYVSVSESGPGRLLRARLA